MNSQATPSPLFILCYSRTGSTLLRYIIDTHPLVASPPEFHLGLIATQIEKGYEILLPQQNYMSKNAREQLIISKIRSHLDSMMDTYCKIRNKNWWCEKSVFTIDYFELIKSIYPDAKFICLYRNCLDQVRSGIEVLQNIDPALVPHFGYTPYLQNTTPNIEAGLADYWAHKTRMLMSIEKHNKDRCFRITYEEIVDRKEQAFDKLFKFIGIDWDPIILDKVFKVHHTFGPGDHKISQENNIHKNSIGRGNEIDLNKIGVERIKLINTLHRQLKYKKIKHK